MIEVDNRAGFLSMYGSDGKPKEPFRVRRYVSIELLPTDNVTSLVNVELAEYAWLFGLTRVTSLAGVKFAKRVRLYDLSSINTLSDVTFIKDMRLYGLTNITTLDGVKFAKDVTLNGLTNVTTLDGVKFAKGVRLYGLTNITTLDGVKFAKDVTLKGLNNVTSLGNVEFADGIRLYGLYNVIVNPVNITEDELAILRQIPIDNLDMSGWHNDCGTTHCLAGWAQVLSGLESDDASAYDDGCRLLPSMQWYFFASTDAVKQYLQSIQK